MFETSNEQDPLKSTTVPTFQHQQLHDWPQNQEFNFNDDFWWNINRLTELYINNNNNMSQFYSQQQQLANLKKGLSNMRQSNQIISPQTSLSSSSQNGSNNHKHMNRNRSNWSKPASSLTSPSPMILSKFYSLQQQQQHNSSNNSINTNTSSMPINNSYPNTNSNLNNVNNRIFGRVITNNLVYSHRI
jgi:hypothetical protein